MLTTCGILKRLASALLWKIWKHLDISDIKNREDGNMSTADCFSPWKFGRAFQSYGARAKR